jgi:hypothetical protein
MNDDEKRLAENLRSDAWRNSAEGYFELGNDAQPIGAPRSSDLLTMHDELWWAAKVNEAGDRKLADLLRRAQARISALETLCTALKNVKVCENENRGDSNANG